jgi:hypothetical protein
MKEGAQDYLVKPFGAEELVLRLRRAIEDQSLRNVVEAGRQAGEQDLVGESPAMRQIMARIYKLAATPSTVLITGESGSGKEVVARLIHARSGAAGPFVAVNLGGLPEGLIERAVPATSAGLSREPTRASRAPSSWPAAAPFSWMKSGRCPAACRSSSCACCRTRGCAAWEALRTSRWTPASFPPPTASWPRP